MTLKLKSCEYKNSLSMISLFYQFLMLQIIHTNTGILVYTCNCKLNVHKHGNVTRFFLRFGGN